MLGELSLQQQASFFRRWHTLAQGGLSTLSAMDHLALHPGMRGLEEPAKALRSAWAEQRTVAETMGRCGRAFTPLQVAVVRAAERSGSLAEALGLLASFAEREMELRRKAQVWTFYTKLQIAVFALVLLVILYCTGAVPQFWYVKILLLIGMAGVGLWFILRILHVVPAGKEVLDPVALRAPLFAQGNYLAAVSKFLWALSTLYKAGCGLTESIEVSADSSGNAELARRIRGVAPCVQTGRPLADCIAESGALDADTLSVIATGETSGRLDVSLEKLGNHYARMAEIELEKAYRTLTAIIGIIVTVLIGAWIVMFYLGRLVG